MKHIITFGFCFLLVSCKDCANRHYATFYDKRCKKIMDEASKEGKETNVCYQHPKDSKRPMFAKDRPRLDPDHKACNALLAEARAKCDALPPPGPDDIVQTSGSHIGRGKHPQSGFLEQYHRMIGFPTGRDRPVCP